MISINEPNEQNEKLRSTLKDQIQSTKTRLEELKKGPIREADFTLLKNKLDEIEKLRAGIKEEGFSFLKEELNEIGKFNDEVKEEDFTFTGSVTKEVESQFSALWKEIGFLKDILGALAMRSFLKEETEDIEKELKKLKGKIKEEDFNSLQVQLKERTEALDSLQDEDNSQLFVLRREIGVLKESAQSFSVKQKWWSRIPSALWVLIFTVPVIVYIFWLSFVQWRNQGQIYDYPATQTAVATQTLGASTPATPTFPPTTPVP